MSAVSTRDRLLSAHQKSASQRTRPAPAATVTGSGASRVRTPARPGRPSRARLAWASGHGDALHPDECLSGPGANRSTRARLRSRARWRPGAGLASTEETATPRNEPGAGEVLESAKVRVVDDTFDNTMARE